MTDWTSWAVVNTNPDPELHEQLMAVDGMVDGRDVPLFTGTLDEFCQRWGKPFSVYKFGRYIKVGGDA